MLDSNTIEFHTPKIATSLSSTSLSSALSDIASGGVETLGSVKTCPTCGRIEDSPRQFLVCSGCALVAYCSAYVIFNIVYLQKYVLTHCETTSSICMMFYIRFSQSLPTSGLVEAQTRLSSALILLI